MDNIILNIQNNKDKQSPSHLNQKTIISKDDIKINLTHTISIKSITININGVDHNVETKSYYFEYPKHIQKSTGIIGYTKTKISNNGMFRLLSKKYTQEERNNYIENTNLHTSYNDNNQNYKSRLIEGDLLYIRNINSSISNLSKDICSQLSNKEYPDRCYLHKMGAHKLSNTNDYIQGFKDDNFFLQKIFDIDRIKKLQNTNNINNEKNILNHGPEQKDNNGLSFRNKEVDQEPMIHPNLRPKDLLGLKDNEFAISNGLNMTMSQFWYDSKLISSEIGFGIPITLENFYKNYLYDYYRSYLEMGAERGFINDSTIYSIRDTIIYDVFYKHGLFTYNNNKKPQILQDIIKDVLYIGNKEFKDYAEKYKNKLIEQFGKDCFEKDLVKMYYVFEENKLESHIKGLFNHFEKYQKSEHRPMSIIINHDKLQQLSWGHAKYAHYVDLQGNFNFFEFKNADHLPQHT